MGYLSGFCKDFLRCFSLAERKTAGKERIKSCPDFCLRRMKNYQKASQVLLIGQGSAGAVSGVGGDAGEGGRVGVILSGE